MSAPMDIDSKSTKDQKSANGSAGSGAPATGTGGPGSDDTFSRDEFAKNQEDAGLVGFRVVQNNGDPQNMIDLIFLKNIFSTQLPKMPKEYIVRLVLDRNHRSMCILKKNKVIGGICFRPFPTQSFAEIVFCAITSSEQVKGYGTRIMNHLKEHVKMERIEYFLTFADNYAIGYFKKQGFTKQVSMPKERWVGFIKDYDGGTLMECRINQKVNYLDIPGMIHKQREAVYEKIKKISNSHQIFPGLNFNAAPPTAANANTATATPTAIATATAATSLTVAANTTTASGGAAPASSPTSGSTTPTNGAAAASSEQKRRFNIEDIPGVKEAGYKPSRQSSRFQSDARPSQLTDLQAKLGAVLKAVKNVKDAWPFQKPVNGKLVPDYYEIIKEPMDFETMSARLNSYHYKTKEMFVYDFNLVVNNCKTYNQPSTTYYRCAEVVEENFKRVIATIF